jgi:hypothetical protein
MKCAKRWIGSLLVLCCVALGAAPVEAYVSEGPCVDTDNSNLKVSAFISSSETDYKLKVDNQEDFDTELERKFIGISLTKAIDRKMDVYGAVGYLFDGSLTPENIDDIELDSGYFLSAGARYMVFQSGNVSAHIFGQFDYILEEKFSDTINGTDVDLELDGYEFLLGGAISFKINDKFSTYAGISFLPLADMTYDEEERAGGITTNSDGDIERDDELGFKAGASYLINNQWSIRGEADFVSDKAFVVSAGMKF